MEHALFLNGVFRSTLEEILAAQRSEGNLICYIQPYSKGSIRFLADGNPTEVNPIPIFFSTTDSLGDVQYRAKIVQWEDKRELSQNRITHVDAFIKRYQPEEGGLYLVDDDGKKYVNLISIRRLARLAHSIPVTHLTKLSDGKPHGVRTQAGMWSPVSIPEDLLIDEASFTIDYLQQDLEKRLSESLQQTDDELLRRCREAVPVRNRIKIASTGFVRNANVIAYSLRRANGVCEECGNPAPFTRKSDGTPFLETHHVEPLSQGGEDTIDNVIALCPNCHRKAHYGE